MTRLGCVTRANTRAKAYHAVHRWATRSGLAAPRSRGVAVACEDVAHGKRERDERGIAAKRENSARLEARDQRLVPHRRRNATELRDDGDHAFRLRQQILVADLERALAERRGLLARLFDVLLPHRERLDESPAAPRREHTECVI